ncbi:MAG: TMEM175 family protein [Leptospirales bacterium]
MGKSRLEALGDGVIAIIITIMVLELRVPHGESLYDLAPVIPPFIDQQFEYTMDLSWKLLQRYLKHIAQVDEGAIRTKNDLFREAARLRIIASAAA